MDLEGVIGANRAGVLQLRLLVDPVEQPLNRLSQATHAAVVERLPRS
jgi:hypothetical protein